MRSVHRCAGPKGTSPDSSPTSAAGLPARRVVLRAGLAGLALLAACSSADVPGPGSADPTSLAEPLATRIAVSELALMQALKVPLAKAGQAATRGSVPLVAGRDGLLRVYVTPEAGWTPKTVTARIRLVTESPGGGFTKVLSATKTVSGASTEADLESTINVPIPGVYLQPTSKFVVVLNTADGAAPSDAPSPARYPATGALAPLDAKAGAEVLRVKLVPVQYGADGSNRLPDVGEAQLERLRKMLYKLYPVARVEISVHEPFPWTQPVSPSGKGLSELLDAIGQLRRSEQAGNDLYYYGAVNPTPTYDDFCRGSCTTGLSPTSSAHSVGVGFGGSDEVGNKTAETAAHEIGHAHGLSHAPCGGAAGPDPAYPTDAEHAGARIGTWGFDQTTGKLVDPGGAQPPKDIMAYCRPSWISDFHYQKLFERVRGDNDYLAMRVGPGAGLQVRRGFRIDAEGQLAGPGHLARDPGLERGEPREVAWRAHAGGLLGTGTARFFAYDHLPGGELWLPEPPADAATAEVAGFAGPLPVSSR